MNENQDRWLESAIDSELKSLPELRAPANFSRRVMAAVQKKAALPWYQRSWQTWPIGLRYASVMIMAVVLSGAGYGLMQLPRLEAVASITTGANNIFGAVQAFLNVLSALGNSMLLVLQKLGPVAITGIVVSMLLGYAMCVGLGTVYVRLALARR